MNGVPGRRATYEQNERTEQKKDTRRKEPASHGARAWDRALDPVHFQWRFHGSMEVTRGNHDIQGQRDYLGFVVTEVETVTGLEFL